MNMLGPTAFARAAGEHLARSALMAVDNIRFVSAIVVSDPNTWPVQIDVHFLDPAGAGYVWDAGSYDYTEIPGTGRDVDEADIEIILNDWCVVAGANLAEWVAVRDREVWDCVRPDILRAEN